MATLKSRQHQIPNGLKFTIPELRWSAAPFSSFDSIVNAVLSVVRANRDMAAQHQWPTERADVETWVERYNVLLCQQNGWHDYLLEPSTSAPPPHRSMSPEEFPVWAKAIRLLKKDGHKGIGDTVESLIGHKNSTAFKEWYRNTFGKDCGCKDRKEWLNRMYPYL